MRRTQNAPTQQRIQQINRFVFRYVFYHVSVPIQGIVSSKDRETAFISAYFQFKAHWNTKYWQLWFENEYHLVKTMLFCIARCSVITDLREEKKKHIQNKTKIHLNPSRTIKKLLEFTHKRYLYPNRIPYLCFQQRNSHSASLDAIGAPRQNDTPINWPNYMFVSWLQLSIKMNIVSPNFRYSEPTTRKRFLNE